MSHHFYEDITDEQLSSVLARFAIPPERRARLVTTWRLHQRRDQDAVTTRLSIRRKLDRLKELYLDGDIDKATFQNQKVALTAELVSLPEDTNPEDGAGERLATLLADLSLAWTVATPEERNRVARQLFTEMIIENRTVVAVRPRPEFLPFFEAVKWCESGSDGGRIRVFCHPGRGAGPHPCPGPSDPGKGNAAIAWPIVA